MSSHSQTGRASPGITIPESLRETLAQIAEHPHKRARNFWQPIGRNATRSLPVIRLEDVTRLCLRNLAKVEHRRNGDVVDLTDLGREIAATIDERRPAWVTH